MNAYELADFIDKYCVDNTSKESAVLLRQQAERITELENINNTEDIKKRIKHSLCHTPISIQSRVYFDGEEISNLRMTHEEIKGEK